MPARTKLITSATAVGAVACAAVALWWWVDADREVFYTDGGALREVMPGPAPRDVLWQSPEPVVTIDGKPIEAIDAYVSADESVMVLVRASGSGDTDLFRSDRSGGGWGEPVPIVSLNTLDNERDPALSPDGERLYFASDRPGGSGGLDIWVSSRVGDGWTQPAPCGFNSREDDADPHVVGHPETGGDVVLFASDRENHEHSEEGPGHTRSVYIAHDGGASMVLPGGPERTLQDPAAAPSSDFVYWVARDLDGERESELVRARIPLEQSGDDEMPVIPEPLDRSINSAQGVRSPSITLEGFAIQFIAELDGRPVLHRAVSREVYLSRKTSRSDLLGLIPWILLALAVVLLLSLLRAGARDVRWKSALGTLGLMARCVLVSLLLHAGLMALLAALHVPEDSGDPSAQSAGQVSLSSSGVRSALAGQLREVATEMSFEGADVPAPSSVEAMAMGRAAEPVEMQPGRSGAIHATRVEAIPSPGERSARYVAVSAASIAESNMPELAESSAQIAVPGSAAPTRADAVEPSTPGVRLFETPTVPATVSSVRVGAGSMQDAPTYEASSEPVRVARSQDTGLRHAGAGAHAVSRVPVELGAAALPSLDIDMPGVASRSIRTPGSDDRGVDNVAEDGAAQIRRADVGVSDPVIPAGGDQGGRAVELMPGRGTLAAPGELEREAIAAGAPGRDDSAVRTGGVELPEVSLSFEGLSLPEVIDLTFDITGLVLDDETEEPLAGATVRLDLADEDDIVVETRSDGSFGLSFDDVPDNAAVTATMAGYAPGAVNISPEDIENGTRAVLRLSPVNPYLIVFEEDPEVRHLGDDGFSGRINSQFQRESEGLRLTFTVELTREHALLRPSGAELKLLVKGSQLNNTIRINGRRIGTLDKSPNSGAFREQSHSIPSGLLRLGENTIEFRSVDSPGTDHDDFEFVNVRILLQSSDGDAL